MRTRSDKENFVKIVCVNIDEGNTDVSINLLDNKITTVGSTNSREGGYITRKSKQKMDKKYSRGFYQ